VNTKPNILLSERDAERLERLLDTLPDAAFPGKAELMAELERAEVVASEAIPPEVVTMNSTVRFTVSSSNDVFSLTLVYPKDVDDSGTTISILAPVGSALLGLSKGNEIEWSKPGGGTMKVRIDDILYQPERSGELHR
jgi:regulator of nucleoside diphosphate kinase